MNDTPVAGNSQLAVSLDDATGLRSVSFTLTYDPTLLSVTGAVKAGGLPADWTVTPTTNTPGTLVVTAAGTTPLAGTNLPLVLIAASVPNSAPYGALEALRLTTVSANVQAGSSTTSTRSPAITRYTRMLIWGMSTATASTPASTPP